MLTIREAPDSTNDLTLSLDAFVRSIKVRRNTPHSLFLGAGAVGQFWRSIGRGVHLGMEARYLPNK